MKKKSNLQKKLEKKITELANSRTASILAQDENAVSGEKYITPGMPEQIRKLAAEGIVLLKNENNVLPLQPDKVLSVFGRVQHDWFYVGYGSGGDVHPPYTVSLFQGLEDDGIAYNHDLKQIYDQWCEKEENAVNHGFWGHWPYFYEEMPLEKSVCEEAAAQGDTALVVIGRAAGEDRENKLEEGSYYLTPDEKTMLRYVTQSFAHTILLMDCGNVVDMAFTDDYPLDAILYVWQLGQESGHAVADVLCGRVTPSGKMSDTVSGTYEDQPTAKNFGGKDFNQYAEDIYVGYRYFQTYGKEKVRYPFGFGLSYTDFSVQTEKASWDEAARGANFEIKVDNIGQASGKEVVQIYLEAKGGALDKPARVLAGFRKTGLLQPGESEKLRIFVPDHDIASFDDRGDTGFKDAFVLDAGTYTFYVGNSVLADAAALTFTLDQPRLVEQCCEVMSPASDPGLKGEDPDMAFRAISGKKIAAGSRDLKQRILENLPKEITPTGDRGIKLEDVREGKYTLKEFIAQLSDEELGDLTRGHGMMDSSLGTSGNAGAFGGITESLRAKGIPAIITADGPAGLRVKTYTTLLPCGTAIACSWNTKLVEETFVLMGQEVRHFGVDVNLAPGMNIHRNPLCGRNFEYYSEDPMLSGRTAAAMVRGLQRGGAAACPKHFACNNQEFKRNTNDSRVSMRALREIYLKNFEYCIKEGHPRTIMTSYNKVNGVWSHYNYDLVTTVLRREWGFDGCVVTDWWMQSSASPEFPSLKNSAYRTRAQVDVLMPGGASYTEKNYVFDRKQLETLGQPDGLTRGELQRTAMNVLKLALNLNKDA